MKNIMRFLIVSSFVLTQASIAQWVQTSLDSVSVTTLTTNDTNIFVGTGNASNDWDGFGIFLSTNQGSSWTEVNSGLPSDYYTHKYSQVNSLVFIGANLFAGTQFGGGVFLSKNNGKSWTVVDSGLAIYCVRALAVIGTNLFAGGYEPNPTWSPSGNGIFLSTNKGSNWTQTTLNNMAIFSLSVVGTFIVASASTGRRKDSAFVFISTTNGSSWSEINTGMPGNSFNTLVASGTNLFAGTGSGVYRSTNNGTSWTAGGLNSANITALAVSGSNLFAGTRRDREAWYTGVHLTTDNGASWNSIDTGLANTSINCLAVIGAYLFAATDAGVWKRPLSEMIPTSVQQSSSQLPDKYSLSQNYPNPFNPSTTITFSIPERSTVRLSIFNTLGQNISEIVNEVKDAGYYEHSFNASELSSGIYFYRIEATSVSKSKTFVETKKMVLMR